MTKRSGRLLGVLGPAVVLSSVAAYSTYSGSSSGCWEDGFGDGICQQDNNNAECGYDGGDCCECTCQVNYHWDCDKDFMACIDPDASCVDDDHITAEMVENCEFASGIGDGQCFGGNNKAECDYDGGDCCECTCVNPRDYDDGFVCSKDSAAGFACIDPDAPCVDDDDITVEVGQNCDTSNLGDGRCHLENNNEICGYDGGDCCECTCVDPQDDDHDWLCDTRFACIDPAAPCVDDDDITADMVENCGWLAGVGDGRCDEENNNELCGYDGGDCCECTCEPPPGYSSRCSVSFACIDPDAPCVNDDDITVDVDESCDTVLMGNGQCTMDNNNEACAYDGGDCCECTCESCGTGPFACIDPGAPCVDDDSLTVRMVENCEYPAGIGDGRCHQENNNELCAYDGGDCCECTCEGNECLSFACIDPNAPCVDDDSITIGMIENCNRGVGIGDGHCNEDLNTPECAYDGGDCCPCTCQNDWEDWACTEFACIDPEAACVDDDDITVDMFDNCEHPLDVGNGLCDQANNNELCGYDGGDCCECTCENGMDDNYWLCSEFACIDPNAACVNDDDITVDMVENCGYISRIGDGICNYSNNKEECGYDGGDCCSCTCQAVWDDDYSCNGEFILFNCIDPNAACFGEETSGTGYFSADDEPMSYQFFLWEETEALPTVDGAVEVGTKTEVGVSATAHDVRPGRSSNEAGCGEADGLGCTATNTRDGIFSEIESRWSCATKLLDDEEPCHIEFTFAEPQTIMDIQVAFWKGNERTRTLEVHINGELTHTYESYGDSTFNTLGVTATEVLIFVTP